MLCFYALVVPHVAHLQPQVDLLLGVDEHLNRRHHGAAPGVHHALLGHGERARACDGCRARCDGLIEHLYLGHSRPGSDRVVLRAVENNRRHDRRRRGGRMEALQRREPRSAILRRRPAFPRFQNTT